MFKRIIAGHECLVVCKPGPTAPGIIESDLINHYFFTFEKLGLKYEFLVGKGRYEKMEVDNLVKAIEHEIICETGKSST